MKTVYKVARDQAMHIKIILTGIALGVALAGAPVGHASTFSCVDAGPRICTPANDTHGAPYGCYDDGGVLVSALPCHVVVNADGSAEVYN
jgi:hypothetical protein